MSNAAYELYQQMRLLATQKRQGYSVGTSPIDLVVIRNIYKAEGISIKLQDGGLKNLKAAYFSDEDGCDVILNKKLPREVRIFALVHELKHHYCDRILLGTAVPCCIAYDVEPEREIAAEVFAAEFIWPQKDFCIAIQNFGLTKESCSPEKIVYFKKAAKMPVSYKFICKTLERLRIISKGSYKDIKFKKLEESIFGKPFYLTRRRYGFQV